MSRNISRLMLAIMLVSVLTGCSAKKHPADTVALVIVPGTEEYLKIQDRLIEMHEKDNAYGCQLAEDGKRHVTHSEMWKEISRIRHRSAAVYNLVLDSWYAVSLANTPENVADLAEKLRIL